jgi:hypothetical protein
MTCIFRVKNASVFLLFSSGLSILLGFHTQVKALLLRDYVNQLFFPFPLLAPDLQSLLISLFTPVPPTDGPNPSEP